MKSQTENSGNVTPATAATTLHTLKNGLPARLISIPASGMSTRPEPGYFGRIEPADPDEVTRPIYAELNRRDTAR